MPKWQETISVVTCGNSTCSDDVNEEKHKNILEDNLIHTATIAWEIIYNQKAQNSIQYRMTELQQFSKKDQSKIVGCICAGLIETQWIYWLVWGEYLCSHLVQNQYFLFIDVTL